MWSRRIAVVSYCLAMIVSSSVFSSQDPVASLPVGLEVQNRGAIHEAFASPIVFNPAAGPIIPKAPPAAIEEMPPDEKPEGHIVWIPGYWSWEDERKDFIWISGVWREPPPQHIWMPGYWNQLATGYQWVSGIWKKELEESVSYLPAPPPSLEIGATSPQASHTHFWVPGHYEWIAGHYVWRPGYWSHYHPEWVWVPAHYHWTPSGFIFCPGHWDYPLATRGVCFAPVRFVPQVWVTRVYTPVVMLNLGCVTSHFFCRPHFGHYYFGDYYDDSFVTMGYYPWFQYATLRVGPASMGYDPLFAYYHVHTYQYDPQWASNLTMVYSTCRANRMVRPPVVYTPMMKSSNDPNVAKVANFSRVNSVFINQTKFDANALNLARQQSLAPLNMSNTIKVGATIQTARKWETLNAANKQQFAVQGMQQADIIKQRVLLEKSALQQRSTSGASSTNQAQTLQLPSNMRSLLISTRPKSLPSLQATTLRTGTTTSTTKQITTQSSTKTGIAVKKFDSSIGDASKKAIKIGSTTGKSAVKSTGSTPSIIRTLPPPKPPGPPPTIQATKIDSTKRTKKGQND